MEVSSREGGSAVGVHDVQPCRRESILVDGRGVVVGGAVLSVADFGACLRAAVALELLGGFDLVLVSVLSSSSSSSSSSYVWITVAEAMRAETRDGCGGEIFRRLDAGALRTLRIMSGFW